jgi:flagellar biosynthesis protein FlhG
MLDQAEALRTLVRDRLICRSASPRRPRVYTIAVTSGKGGVGKTSISVNLALLLARGGRRVRIVDADFGLANAEVLLGVKPRYTLNDVLQGAVDVRDAWVEAPGGVSLLSSGSGLEEIANIDGSIGATLLDHVLGSVSDGEVVVVDTGPGIDDQVASLLALADEVMMVTTPEPTSVADTYAALKVLLSRSPAAEITLVANCCSSPAQASAVAAGIDSVCRRFLNAGFQRHEYLPLDAGVGWAVRMRKPLVLSSPRSAVVPWLRKTAIRLEERIRTHAHAGAAARPETRKPVVPVELTAERFAVVEA